jgi:hypothetical protein
MEALALSSSPAGARFCKDNEPSYAAMAANVRDQTDAFGYAETWEEAIACFCGD